MHFFDNTRFYIIPENYKPLEIKCKNPKNELNVVYNGFHYDVLEFYETIENFDIEYTDNSSIGDWGDELVFDSPPPPQYKNSLELNLCFRFHKLDEFKETGNASNLLLFLDSLKTYQIYEIILDYIFRNNYIECETKTHQDCCQSLLNNIKCFLFIFYKYKLDGVKLLDEIENSSVIKNLDTRELNFFFKDLYDLIDFPQIDTEKIFIDWYYNVGNGSIIKIKIEPFMEWLLSAEEE